jgi:hypothetical protein
MEIITTLFVVGALLELGLHLPGLWRIRNFLALLAMLATMFATGLLLSHPSVWAVLLALVTAYRTFNMLRILEGRMAERYMQPVTFRTSVALIISQIAIWLIWWAWNSWYAGGVTPWVMLAAVQLVVAIVLLSSTIRRLRRTTWPKHSKHLSDNDLPTVTVAIPARNETDDLRACLDSLVGCDYPKLEILVLDDCSQTRKTPEIIREYAHAGVRFIKGEEPKDNWLPKNQAYDHLAREASGELILFCGVDVRFGPKSLRDLVALMAAKQKPMVCILPWRADNTQGRFAVTQAMRYFWELVPPRRLFNRPPVLSTCWIIAKQYLKEAGGFEAVTRAIVPEAHFARELIKVDGYSFVRASKDTGIESVKPPAEQRATAVRMRYPQLHKRPENVLLVAVADILFLLLPVVVVVLGFFVAIGLLAQALALLAAVLLAAAHFRVVQATRTGSTVSGLLALPYSVLYDLMLLHYSMYKYEFSVVDWKGRNVCVPAMHVIPHLPKI